MFSGGFYRNKEDALKRLYARSGKGFSDFGGEFLRFGSICMIWRKKPNKCRNDLN